MKVVSLRLLDVSLSGHRLVLRELENTHYQVACECGLTWTSTEYSEPVYGEKTKGIKAFAIQHLNEIQRSKQMARMKTIKYERKKAVGQYQNATIAVEYELDPQDNPNDILRVMQRFVTEKLNGVAKFEADFAEWLEAKRQTERLKAVEQKINSDDIVPF